MSYDPKYEDEENHTSTNINAIVSSPSNEDGVQYCDENSPGHDGSLVKSSLKRTRDIAVEKSHPRKTQKESKVDVQLEGKTETEEQICSRMNKLLMAIESIVSHDGPVKADFRALYDNAILSHHALVKYSRSIECGVTNLNLSQKNGPNDVKALDKNKRDELCDVGKRMWSFVLSNPNFFYDFVSVNPKEMNNPCKASISSIDRHQYQDPIELDETLQRQKHRAAAGGHIRAIAARLVLVKNIQTSMTRTPRLVIIQTNDIPNRSDYVNSEREAIEKMADNHLPTTTSNMLEFGLRAFSRAGIAIFTHSSDPSLAYDVLSLAFDCWEIIEKMAIEANAKNGPLNKEEKEICILSQQMLEEAFDALILLPDAALLVKEHCVLSHTETETRILPSYSPISTPDNVIKQLQRLEMFDVRRKKAPCNPLDYTRPAILFVQRYYPAITEVASKHGHYFAQLANYSQSQKALKISIGTADRCISIIRDYISKEKREFSDDSDLSNHGILKSLQLQEQEMLVINKKCLFILCHVSLSLQDRKEALACLDRVERMVDEQRKCDDNLYSLTMKNLESSLRNVGEKLQPSEIALEGPKEQDRIDIKARAEVAQVKARYAEIAERGNIAFSKFMVYHQTKPTPSDQDEILIDEQIAKLSHLAIEFNNNSTDHKDSKNDSIKLVLTTARLTTIRRLLLNEKQYEKFEEPYKLLLHNCPKSFKYFFIILDRLGAILTTVQKYHEKCGTAKKTTKSQHDVRASRAGASFLNEFREFFKMQYMNNNTNGSEPTLFPPDDRAYEQYKLLVENSKTKISQGLSIYRYFDIHSASVEWSDNLLEFLELSNKAVYSIAGLPESLQKNYLLGSSKNEMNKLTCEVLTIKALALTSNDETSKGLAVARDAWKLSSMYPTSNNLAALFHCVVKRFSDTKKDKASECCDPLLELDSAISSFINVRKTIPSEKTPHEQLLEVFPVFANSCLGENLITVGVLHRWIDLFIRTEFVLKTVCKRDKNFSEQDKLNSFSISLFSIVQNYLCMVEDILSKYILEKKIDTSIQVCESLDRILDDVLQFIVKIRGRKITVATAEHGKNTGLIWEDKLTCDIIGDNKACVWIAEQVWNLAIQSLSMEESIEQNICRWIASQLFAKAHDFALLSEEEEGSLLTKGYLDIDNSCWSHDEDVLFSAFDDKSLSSSELCSEFSAQCLILAAANAVDFHACRDSSFDENLLPENYLKRSLKRLVIATNEYESIDSSEISRKNTRRMVCWLALRCLVEIGDDHCCSSSLENHGLANFLQNELISHQVDSDRNDILVPTHDASSESMSSILHTYLVACRAENCCMSKTAKCLFSICANYLSKKKQKYIDQQEKSHSLGSIQGRLVRSASSVREVKKLFEQIYANVLPDVMNLRQGSSSKVTSSCDQDRIYSGDEIDFFTIEAYNKGINLLFIGDALNAEIFLATALNMLPICSMDVQIYGAEMRQTYCGLIESKSCSHAASISSEDILGLFGSGVD